MMIPRPRVGTLVCRTDACLIPGVQILRCCLVEIISIYNSAIKFCTTRVSMLDCDSRRSSPSRVRIAGNHKHVTNYSYCCYYCMIIILYDICCISLCSRTYRILFQVLLYNTYPKVYRIPSQNTVTLFECKFGISGTLTSPYLVPSAVTCCFGTVIRT